MRYLIVNAFGRSNRGDAVLLEECIEQIRATDRDASISIALFEGVESARGLIKDVKWTERIGNGHHFSGALGRIESLFYLAVAWLSSVLRARWLGRLLPADQRMTLDAYFDADAVISAPGGYIHDTNFAYVIAIAHLAYGIGVGVPVVLAPQSVGPLESNLARRLCRSVLSRCAAICARESYSYGFLTKDLGLPASLIHEAGDSAFWNFDIVDDEAAIGSELQAIGLAPGERFVGATVVEWSFPHEANVDLLRTQYLDRVSAVIRHVHETYGLRTIIFNQVASDLSAARYVAERVPQSALVDTGDRHPSLMRGMIGRSEAFLATRFHSCIFAMIGGVPVAAIAYLPKTDYIMRDLGLDELVLDIRAVDQARLTGLMDAALSDPPTAAAAINDAVARYRRTKRQLSDVLSAVLARPGSRSAAA